MILSVYSMVIL